MPTVFTMIINGEIPGHFVYRDDVCVAFMSIEPLRTGHTLVVPVVEIDHWVDLDEEVLTHLFVVSQKIAAAIADAYPSEKVGMMLAGLEVPHVHVHLVPIDSPEDLDFSNATPAESADLATAAKRISDAMTN